MPLTIVSVSDPEYIKHLLPLAASLRINFPEARVYFHLVNVEECSCAVLLKAHPKAELAHEKKQFSNIKQKSAYCANVRAKVVASLLEKGRDKVLYLDADSLVRSSLSALSSLIDDHDVSVHHRQQITTELEATMPYLVGVLGFRNTPATLAFVRCWRDLVEPKIYNWFSDQFCFDQAMKIHKEALTIADLDFGYIDWECGHNSSIWAGKGTRKFEQRIYVLEEQYFRVKAIGKSDILSRLCIRCHRQIEKHPILKHWIKSAMRKLQ